MSIFALNIAGTIIHTCTTTVMWSFRLHDVATNILCMYSYIGDGDNMIKNSHGVEYADNLHTHLQGV